MNGAQEASAAGAQIAHGLEILNADALHVLGAASENATVLVLDSSKRVVLPVGRGHGHDVCRRSEMRSGAHALTRADGPTCELSMMLWSAGFSPVHVMMTIGLPGTSCTRMSDTANMCVMVCE
jgi:hypothetical protein